MPDKDELKKQTFLQKLLFYTTAFFILLGTFSLFAFLFLVPFVIDPAFTTIFMDFDLRPAECVTIDVESRRGTSNCSWTSCREGCTRELFECTQIRVNYKLPINVTFNEVNGKTGGVAKGVGKDENAAGKKPRLERSLIREYDYIEDLDDEDDFNEDEDDNVDGLPKPFPTGLMGNDSEWYFTGAKLFPNVKGCGYPPMLNCTIFVRNYANVGQNFSCYYSKVDPGIVISDLNMRQVYLNLVYAMAIPIPSFIISVIYLTIAYFKIYNEDEVALVGAEEAGGMTADDDEVGDAIIDDTDNVDGVIDDTGGCGGDGGDGDITTSDTQTPMSEAFGHQLKVAMVDDNNSRESLDVIADNCSVQGNLSKTMTTSISTHPGPTAAV